MNSEEFWNLVARVHETSGGDMDRKCKLLAGELHKLTPDEVQSFGCKFFEFRDRAYSWELWDAAYIINGGCSDDSFTDFRSTLISMGRQIFDAALVDPESLAEVDIGAGQPTYEGYQYVVYEVYEELTREEIPLRNKHPSEPSGVHAEEWEMEERFPKLTAKFGHKDSNYIWQKDRAASEAAEDRLADMVVELSLSERIIPSRGLIPPFSVLADILRKGFSPENNHSWEPIELKEPVYWKVVLKLEKSEPEALASRPDLQGIKLDQDLGAHGIATFEEWFGSLKKRGLL